MEHYNEKKITIFINIVNIFNFLMCPLLNSLNGYFYVVFSCIFFILSNIKHVYRLFSLLAVQNCY